MVSIFTGFHSFYKLWNHYLNKKLLSQLKSSCCSCYQGQKKVLLISHSRRGGGTRPSKTALSTTGTLPIHTPALRAEEEAPLTSHHYGRERKSPASVSPPPVAEWKIPNSVFKEDEREDLYWPTWIERRNGTPSTFLCPGAEVGEGWTAIRPVSVDVGQKDTYRPQTLLYQLGNGTHLSSRKSEWERHSHPHLCFPRRERKMNRHAECSSSRPSPQPATVDSLFLK